MLDCNVAEGSTGGIQKSDRFLLLSDRNAVNATQVAIFHAMVDLIPVMANVYQKLGTSFNAVIAATATGVEIRINKMDLDAENIPDFMFTPCSNSNNVFRTYPVGLTIRSTEPVAACG